MPAAMPTNLNHSKSPSISAEASLVIQSSSTDICSLKLNSNGSSMTLQKSEQWTILDQNRRLYDLHVCRYTASYWLEESQEKSSKFRSCLINHCNAIICGTTLGRLTTILSPSMTSPKSRAALTLVRAFEVFSLRSKSAIASNHGSPTLVSRMTVARGGGIVISDKREDSGFSILYVVPCQPMSKQWVFATYLPSLQPAVNVLTPILQLRDLPRYRS